MASNALDTFTALDLPLSEVEILRAAFDNAPFGMALLAMDGRLLLTNAVLRQMLGYGADELVGRGLDDFLSREDRELLQQWLARAEDGKALAMEARCQRKSGNLIWTSLNLQVQRDRSGIGCAVLVYAQDITERRLAEETFQENEEKFRIAFEHSPLGMSLFRADGTYMAVNPTVCRMFGYTKEELLSSSLAVVTHPDDLERSAEWIRKCVAGVPCEPEFEKRFIHKDGHVMWGVVTSTWLRDAAGKPRMSVAYVRDITFQKQAELALRESEARLREAHEISRMGHWHLSPGADEMSWSPGIYPLLGIEADADKPTYAAFLSRVHPEDRAQVETTLASVAASGEPCDFIYRLNLPGGETRHLRLLARPGLSAKANQPGITGVLQDVSAIRRAEEERRRLEAQLNAAQRMEAIGQLAGGVAHDFNNLLTAMDANAALAQEEVHPSARAAGNLLEIRKAVQSASHLTRQLLAFSRKQAVVPKVLDLNGVVRNMAQMLTRLLGGQVRLSCKLDEGIGRVRMDAGQLDQILINLAVNARDAMAAGGTLTVQTATTVLDHEYCRRTPDVLPGEYVLLAVSDTGVGMGPEVKSRLFEPFFTTKEIGRGTGLGLAMVYGAVRQHGGHIEVLSEVNQGTTFNVYLPRVEDTPEPAPSDRKPTSDGGHEGILLVEDDAAIRRVAKQHLDHLGYRVYAYPSGNAALTALGDISESITLLLTDVVMPGIDGKTLAEACLRRRPHLRVLLTSGYPPAVSSQDGSLEPSIDFLAKPYTLDALARKVREVLDRKRSAS